VHPTFVWYLSFPIGARRRSRGEFPPGRVQASVGVRRRHRLTICPEASGGELEQIQFLLGHVSVQKTERYLGCKSGFDRPSMMALASSRLLELWAAVEGLPAILRGLMRVSRFR
jgi:hypothetical protein